MRPNRRHPPPGPPLYNQQLFRILLKRIRIRNQGNAIYPQMTTQIICYFPLVFQVLIPILTVEKITKEKTARIIPNAVGIVTSDDKHVFGSLMSRDNTLAFMTKIWEKAKTASPVEPEIIVSQRLKSRWKKLNNYWKMQIT